jgi:hypothetical protein
MRPLQTLITTTLLSVSLLAVGVRAEAQLPGARTPGAGQAGAGFRDAMRERMKSRLADRREQMLAELQAELALNPNQQAEWNSLVERRKDLAESNREARADLMEQSAAQLRQGADPAALLRNAQQLQDQHMHAKRAFQQDALAFYGRLSPSQQATVRTRLADGLDRLVDVQAAVGALIED